MGIVSSDGHRTLALTEYHSDTVDVILVDPGEWVTARRGTFKQSDFKELLKSQLGWVVIDLTSGQLGKWELDNYGVSEPEHMTAEIAELLSAHFAVRSEQLRKNPPIDQEQLNALIAFLRDEGDGGIWEDIDESNARAIAEALLRSGKVTVSTNDKEN